LFLLFFSFRKRSRSVETSFSSRLQKKGLSLRFFFFQLRNQTHAILEATSDPRIIGADSQGERFFLLRRRFFLRFDEEEAMSLLLLLPPSSSSMTALPLRMGVRRLLLSAMRLLPSAAVIAVPLLKDGPLGPLLA